MVGYDGMDPGPTFKMRKGRGKHAYSNVFASTYLLCRSRREVHQ